VNAPINTGTTDQVKSAGLGVNSLTVNGSADLTGPSSYLNFGVTVGSGGYGIRDSAGTLEFKNTGGAWNNFTNTVLSILGAGAITSLKFSDGSTQTTAASTGHASCAAGNSSQLSTGSGGYAFPALSDGQEYRLANGNSCGTPMMVACLNGDVFIVERESGCGW